MVKPAKWSLTAAVVVAITVVVWAQANPPADCSKLPNHDALRSALQSIIKEGKTANSGMGNQEWAAVVNRDGLVCVVVYSGPDRGAQWPGSRLIAAEKANTANALSVDNFAISTANLWFASQPGQSLYSLITSAPPNAQAVFSGGPQQFGESNDPFVGKPIGGIIFFGGGLPLYEHGGHIVGGLGVSGDTSCADHVVAWKLRHNLKLDAIPTGPAPGGNDNETAGDLPDFGTCACASKKTQNPNMYCRGSGNIAAVRSFGAANNTLSHVLKTLAFQIEYTGPVSLIAHAVSGTAFLVAGPSKTLTFSDEIVVPVATSRCAVSVPYAPSRYEPKRVFSIPRQKCFRAGFSRVNH